MSTLLFAQLIVFLQSLLLINGKWPPTPCDPLVPEFCSLPWPNDYWLQKDANNNPMNLVFDKINLPITKNGITTNPAYWNTLDGWAPLPAIMAYWDNLSIDNCARFWNISQSNDEDSPIIIMEADTGTRLAHWVELDYSSDDIRPAINRTLMVWPAKRLQDSKRYIVAMRSLYDNNGNLVSPSSAFEALRDNITTNNASIEDRRDYFNQYIFDVLESNGIERSTLQLSWDFTVMSTKQMTSTMLNMRQDAFNRIENKTGVRYSVQKVIDNPANLSYIARKVDAIMYVPWYLNDHTPSDYTRIVRDKKDFFTPIYQGMKEVEFELLIPFSVANGSITNKDSRWIQFGHGLFENYREVEHEYMREKANKFGYVYAGVNWLGLCSQDLPSIVKMLAENITNFQMVPDRSHQGMLNALYLMKLFLSPQFQGDDNIFMFDGIGNVAPDSANRNYFGNSLGGILGSVYMSLTSDVKQGVISVPGYPFSLLLPRSINFRSFFDILKDRYIQDVDRIMLMSWFELLWVRLEPAGYINHLNKDPFTGNPIHNVIIESALGDAQVSWLAGQNIGRTLDCYMYDSDVSEGNETLYGYDFINDNVVINISESDNNGACMIQIWNYNVPLVPFVNLPPPRTYDTHGFNKLQPQTQQENHDLFTQGILYNDCDGPCNGITPSPTKSAM